MRKIEWSDKVHPSKLKNPFKSWIQKLGYGALAEIMSKEVSVKEGKQLDEHVAGVDDDEVSPLDGGDGEKADEPEFKDDITTDAAETEPNGKPAKSSKASAESSKQEKDTKGETKRKLDSVDEAESKRGRGRPRKIPTKSETDTVAKPGSGPKRGRGRPPKIVSAAEAKKLESKGPSGPKRGRGRPPKSEKTTLQPQSVENKDAKDDRVEEEVDVM